MSISAAFANALSGLAAASRRTDVISGNVANAMTEGYARRETLLAADTLGGRGAGVRVADVRRVEDPRATADRREAEAASGGAGVAAAAEARLLAAVGDHGAPGALPALSTKLETTLRALADAPESASLRSAALDAAKDLARGVNRAAAETARLRMDADAAIAREVASVNAALKRIEDLNGEIRAESAVGGRVAALQEARQRDIDLIAEAIPVRTVQREGGALALFTANGAVLLDGRASELGFRATGVITADMTLSGGALSGLSLDGRPVRAGAADAGALRLSRTFSSSEVGSRGSAAVPRSGRPRRRGGPRRAVARSRSGSAS